MDFYSEQDSARRNTRLLVILFLCAVVVLILISNVLIAALLFFAGAAGMTLADGDTINSFLSGFNIETFAWVSLGVISTVFLVVLFKWAQLAAGGKAVAESMGGTRIIPATEDVAQRRCLNVVEEMALAAGLPVPPVYLLAGERGINAFAAGISPADAVIGITQGSLDKFNREQLQGVVAHEFSHILNGDMRLNIRLAALLKGITFIGDIGEVIVRGGSRRGRSYKSSKKMPAQILAIGLALWVMGWLGGLFAGFIKAAISRQKEYLADASAVQFTRNPEGVADALKVIGGHIPGSVVVASRANELSHIFFGQIASSLWQVFATHPPLQERIRRIQPNWDGQFIKQSAQPSYQGTKADQDRRAAMEKAAKIATTATIAGAVIGASAENAFHAAVAQADADFADLPLSPQLELADGLIEQAHDPLGANAMVYSLLLSQNSEIQAAQLQLVTETGVKGLPTTVLQLAPQVNALPVQLRLPLLELCLPALKCMSAPQYQVFKRTLLQLAQADREISLYEWCVYQVTRHYLDVEFVQVKPSKARYRKAVHVRQQYRTILSVLVWQGHADDASREAAFQRGADAVELQGLSLMALSDCGVSAFSKAVHELADCYPLLKPRLLKGMAAAAAHDEELTAVEVEVLVSVAAVMDCPVPASVRLEATIKPGTDRGA
jgi:Zn-dependent protease with chaperone function